MCRFVGEYLKLQEATLNELTPMGVNVQIEFERKWFCFFRRNVDPDLLHLLILFAD